ncbi:MAG: 50S ribosomal protein L15 [Candidatus Curtissbacteria bacterium GW2011_GWA1_40_24]|uniref:Large ribosomal subunit protein uL15 n=1 Tax=Candidatus Curtissbacteria bacterium GW2011_GWA1_40_24 TaxID=1618406 RepID=A0A0G0RSG1_9BACT|nr:MAG: 50S ribosomal protein L15 [Candidatus Curtissbacteria bacterium GW2011_GWA1_40_24]
MKLENLSKIAGKNKKRVGRGPGSGKGKTAGRGTKGQKARGGLSIGHSHYEGGQRPLFKRLPYRRGKGNPKITKKPIVVNLEALNLLPAGEKVNLESLIKFKIVDKKDAQIFGVKILGDGKLTKALTISLPISKSAALKVQKAGGKIQET